ncbi:MAG: GTPase Era [Myxococcales bacterium]
MSRFGRVALLGRSNVGKSTLLNAALDHPLAIVSPLPQTTRTSLLGVVSRGDVQLALLDTPGLHQPRSELGRRMNAAAVEAIRQADVRVFVTDVSVVVHARRNKGRDKQIAPALEDLELLRMLDGGVPTLLVVNKVDLVAQKSLLLPYLASWQSAYPFASILPVSCLDRGDVERVLSAIGSLLPEGPAQYSGEDLTDRPMRYFAAEYVREQILLHMRREVPHAVAVSIDAFNETDALVSIAATLHVEKEGQRRILIGKGGSAIRSIGQLARQRIAELVQKKVHLELFVKTNARWKSVPRQLAELGYHGPATDLTTAPTRKAP